MKPIIHYLENTDFDQHGKIMFHTACEFSIVLTKTGVKADTHRYTTIYGHVSCEDCKEAIGMSALAECP